MHFYSFDMNDYRGATGHLSRDQDLNLRRLLDMYYDKEAPIPNDLELVALRVQATEEELTFILRQFFVQTEKGWHNARCDFEITKYQARAETARKNGKKGGKPARPKLPLDDATPY